MQGATFLEENLNFKHFNVFSTIINLFLTLNLSLSLSPHHPRFVQRNTIFSR